MSDGVVFLVEFSNGVSSGVFGVNSAIKEMPTDGLIQVFDTAYPTGSTYWTDWGGSYDTVSSTNVQLFVEEYLTRVSDPTDGYNTAESSWIVGTFIFMNISTYLWQVWSDLVAIENIYGFSSSVKDQNYPSDDKFFGRRYPTRMEPPTLSTRISNTLNGVSLNNSVSITLANNDGFFDSAVRSEILYSPLVVRKSVTPMDESSYEVVYTGKIENVALSFEEITFSVASLYRGFISPVCKSWGELGFGDVAEKPNDLAPILYGIRTKIDLVATVYPDKFLVVDPTYIYYVVKVQDEEGNSIPYDYFEGIITATDKAKTADVYGLRDRNIGHIIAQEMEWKENIPYTESNWDTTETNAYKNTSARISLLIDSGTTNDLIKTCLSSDMAFLLQRSDGRFTLRTWENLYKIHDLDPWVITEAPTRTFVSYKYFASSVQATFAPVGSSGEEGNSILYDQQESTIYKKFRQKHRLELDFLHEISSEAIDLSARIVTRFGKKTEVLEVGLGVNTTTMSLLDVVRLPMVINGRKFSETSVWKIVGIDPAEDTLVLEELGRIPSLADGPLMVQPLSERGGSLLVQPSSENAGGYMVTPLYISE